MKIWPPLAATIAASALAVPARACVDADNMKSYFSYRQPTRSADMVLLRVRVDTVEGDVVHARLDGAFAALSSDGTVRIWLPEFPFGSNCVDIGPTDGPVFVLGRLGRAPPGQLSLVAMPTRAPRRRMHSRCEIEQYIVDPAYLPPPSRRCRGRAL